MRDDPSYLILKFHSYVMSSLGNKNGNSMNFEQLKFMTYIVRKTYVDLSRNTYVDISYFSSSSWDKSIDFCPNSYHHECLDFRGYLITASRRTVITVTTIIVDIN